MKHAPRRKYATHTAKTGRGRGGYTPPQLYGANTPSRKKIKKISKNKKFQNFLSQQAFCKVVS